MKAVWGAKCKGREATFISLSGGLESPQMTTSKRMNSAYEMKQETMAAAIIQDEGWKGTTGYHTIQSETIQIITHFSVLL